MFEWYKERQRAKRRENWRKELDRMVGTEGVITVMRRFGHPHVILSTQPTRCWLYEWEGETFTLHFDEKMMLERWGAHFDP